MSYRFADSLRAGLGRSSVLILLASCQQTCMTYTIAVCTVRNSWWWTEELSETCRILFQNKFQKLVHLVGFIVRIRLRLFTYFLPTFTTNRSVSWKNSFLRGGELTVYFGSKKNFGKNVSVRFHFISIRRPSCVRTEDLIAFNFQSRNLNSSQSACSQLVNIPFLLAYSNDYRIRSVLLLFYV